MDVDCEEVLLTPQVPWVVMRISVWPVLACEVCGLHRHMPVEPHVDDLECRKFVLEHVACPASRP